MKTETFAERLAIALKNNGISQAELARKLNIDRSTISNYLQGNYEPKKDKIDLMAQILGVSPVWLLGYGTPVDKNISIYEDDDYDEENIIKIPVLGSIPAGIPNETIENVIKYIDIPEEWTQGGKEYFGLLISGNSMYPKYLNNDIVIFKRSCDPLECNNKDCAVMVNPYDATFKKFKFTENGIILQPYNPDYDVRTFTPEDVQVEPLRLIGYAVQIRRDI